MFNCSLLPRNKPERFLLKICYRCHVTSSTIRLAAAFYFFFFFVWWMCVSVCAFGVVDCLIFSLFNKASTQLFLFVALVYLIPIWSMHVILYIHNSWVKSHDVNNNVIFIVFIQFFYYPWMNHASPCNQAWSRCILSIMIHGFSVYLAAFGLNKSRYFLTLFNMVRHVTETWL